LAMAHQAGRDAFILHTRIHILSLSLSLSLTLSLSLSLSLSHTHTHTHTCIPGATEAMHLAREFGAIVSSSRARCIYSTFKNTHAYTLSHTYTNTHALLSPSLPSLSRTLFLSHTPGATGENCNASIRRVRGHGTPSRSRCVHSHESSRNVH